MRVRAQTPKLTEETDASLVEAARSGSVGAFEELYRRHADGAWRVAQAVANNAHDAADAVSDAFVRVFAALPEGRLEEAGQFRGYLLAATRNAAIDTMRKNGRARPTDAVTDVPMVAPDSVVASENSRIVAEAFRELPERWRSVLWLTEVEGMPTREVGARLGLSPNGAAQLAVRARAGLRERFLQAHLRADVQRQCRYTVDRLGAYVAGKLSPRDLAKVDQHLAGCEPCRERKEQLEDVGGRLRAILLPLPLLLGPKVLTNFKAANIASTAAAAPSSSLAWTSSLATKAQKPLLAATSGIFALGVISATVLGGPDAPLRGPRTPPAAIADGSADGSSPEVPAPTDSVEFVNAAFEIPPDIDFSDFDTEAAAAPPPQDSDASRTHTAEPAPAQPPPPPPPATEPEPEPLAQAAITVAAGPLGAGISLGAGDDSCAGGAIYDQGSLGCAPEEPETVDDDTDDLELTASLDGSGLGPVDDTEVTVSLP